MSRLTAVITVALLCVASSVWPQVWAPPGAHADQPHGGSQAVFRCMPEDSAVWWDALQCGDHMGRVGVFDLPPA